MEEVIRRLVEFDEKGRQLVQEALDERREMINHMGDYKKEMADQYKARLERHVELFRQEAQTEKEEQFALASQKHEAQMKRLRLTYQENSGRWIEQIVARCIGG